MWVLAPEPDRITLSKLPDGNDLDLRLNTHSKNRNIAFLQRPTNKCLRLCTVQPVSGDNCAHHIYPHDQIPFAVSVVSLDSSSDSWMLLELCQFHYETQTFWEWMSESNVIVIETWKMFSTWCLTPGLWTTKNKNRLYWMNDSERNDDTKLTNYDFIRIVLTRTDWKFHFSSCTRQISKWL